MGGSDVEERVGEGVVVVHGGVESPDLAQVGVGQVVEDAGHVEIFLD